LRPRASRCAFVRVSSFNVRVGRTLASVTSGMSMEMPGKLHVISESDSQVICAEAAVTRAVKSAIRPNARMMKQLVRSGQEKDRI
jgi:hypothetical protein